MTTPEGTDPIARAAEVLIAHQRFDIQGCICGWAELGRCHARHVAGVLAAAGLLRDTCGDEFETETLLGRERVVYRCNRAPGHAGKVHEGPATDKRYGSARWAAAVEVSDSAAGPWRPVEAGE